MSDPDVDINVVMVPLNPGFADAIDKTLERRARELRDLGVDRRFVDRIDAQITTELDARFVTGEVPSGDARYSGPA